MRPKRAAFINCCKGLVMLDQYPKNTAYKIAYTKTSFKPCCVLCGRQTLVIWYRKDLPFIVVIFITKQGNNFHHLMEQIILGHVLQIFLLTEENLFKLSVNLDGCVKSHQNKLYKQKDISFSNSSNILEFSNCY